MRSSAHETRFSGDFTTPRAALRSSNFWLPASCAAKFMRASMAPLVNQSSPSDHPATFGGSNSCCSIVIIGLSASLTEKPDQPTSLMARATNSDGHEYLLKKFDGSVNVGDVNNRISIGLIS